MQVQRIVLVGHFKLTGWMKSFKVSGALAETWLMLNESISFKSGISPSVMTIGAKWGSVVLWSKFLPYSASLNCVLFNKKPGQHHVYSFLIWLIWLFTRDLKCIYRKIWCRTHFFSSSGTRSVGFTQHFASLCHCQQQISKTSLLLSNPLFSSVLRYQFD